MKAHKIRQLMVLLGSAAVSTWVMAKDGFYLTGFINNSTLEHTIQRDSGSMSTPSITTQDDETGLGYGLAVGYKMHVDENLFVTLEGFYNKEDVRTRNLNNLLQTEVELDSTYGANVKLGFDVAEFFSMYGFIGATRVSFDLANSYPFAPPMRQGSRDETELSYGFGMAYDLSDQLSVIGEYTAINDLDFKPLPEVAVPGKINPNDLNLNSLKVGLSYSF
ncbi:porin family protein [Endozoicomonas sp. YOMI1]|uniref:porin family protein n=1 Tax=Endozoicomonas sp. YOMI1 TaxID=2828739 RepID=UPI002149497C|nr:porin family protein [Endozoicomonas sp. YOMI1]